MFKFLNLKNLLLGALLILLLVSVIVLVLTSYWLSNSSKFVWDPVNPDKATTKGTEAVTFWNNNKIMIMTPSILNVMGALLVVTLVYVA